MTTDVSAMHAAVPMAQDAGSHASPGMAVDDDASSCDSQSHRKYERKSKRFAWPDELHRLFVAAIFDLGLKSASPKALLPFMMPAAADAGLTSEHLKSHLQKYRLNYDKSRAEFLAFFDESARRNGKRRRRTAKSMVSHTRFIFPIQPRTQQQPQDESGDAPPPGKAGLDQLQRLTPQQLSCGGADGCCPEYPSAAMKPPADADAMEQQPVYMGYPQLTPRTSSRLERAQLLRLAQHNAALALAAAASSSSSSSSSNPYGTGLSPRPLTGDGSPGDGIGVSDAQWGILAALLSPQLPPNSGGGGAAPPGFSLNNNNSSNPDASPDLQLQMHLAMQAQMNLHRQMLTRKVAVSQHYYNQAAAVKRAAASAMVERAIQNAAAANHQHQLQQQQPRMTSQRPSLPEAPASQPMMMNAGYQPRYAPPTQNQNQTSLASDALLQATWDPMDIDMAEDQSDLFSFLKATE